MPVEKERLDKLLVDRGFFDTRERAQRAIRSEIVRVDGQILTKTAKKVALDASIVLDGTPFPYVGRGALKLLGALEHFPIALQGKRCLDIGSSTGGFTEVLLEKGASGVTAVDVGRDQLHAKLRGDDRVRVLEQTDFRQLSEMGLGTFDVIVSDVSFISLSHLLPLLPDLMAGGAQVILLIKPQFEAGPAHVGKGGLVTDPAVHRQVIERLFEEAVGVGLYPAGLTPSPITGTGGNREYLCHLGTTRTEQTVDIAPVVRRAFDVERRA